jgi:hypothetical protein
MRTAARSLGITLAVLLTASCSHSADDDHATHDAGTTDDAAAQNSGGPDGAVDGGAKTGKPATPQVTMVMPMGGALHVTWKLNDTSLGAVALMRKKDSGAYAKAYTLPGTAISQHDSGATGSGTYCYQVVTTRDGVDSDPSNEMCGTP